MPYDKSWKNNSLLKCFMVYDEGSNKHKLFDYIKSTLLIFGIQTVTTMYHIE